MPEMNEITLTELWNAKFEETINEVEYASMKAFMFQTVLEWEPKTSKKEKK